MEDMTVCMIIVVLITLLFAKKYLCCYCGEGIYQGERYLDNENGEYMHEDCIGCIGTDKVINWLGFKYKEMEYYDE